MKVFKTGLAITVLALMIGNGYAADPVVKQTNNDTTPVAAQFKNENDQVSYALGISMGRYLESSLKQQAELGISLDQNTLLKGVQDAFSNKSTLSDEQVTKVLQQFDTKLQKLAQEKFEKEAKQNAGVGEKFAEQFAKEPGVKKTASGLLYKIEKPGTGATLKDNDTIVVNYKGSLVDNTVFDDSYKRGEPLTIRLDSVIPGWTEGLKYIHKGGKIKLVIPPKLAYGESGVPGSIPPNSTLIFDIELLNVNPTKAEQASK